MSQFRAAFKEAYGERPWYGEITGMTMSQTTARTLEVRMTEREIESGDDLRGGFQHRR